MSKPVEQALTDITEVLRFENWLRFYFVKEQEDGTLIVDIPEKELAVLQEQAKHLGSLAEQYDKMPLDYEASQARVCSHIALLYDGTKYPDGLVPGVLESRELKIENYLFGLWVSAHEEQLDKEFMHFTAWEEGFFSWRDMPETKSYVAKLTALSDEPSQAEQ